MSTSGQRKVRYVYLRDGAHGSIFWSGRFRMWHGSFPKDHPVPGPIDTDNSVVAPQFGGTAEIKAFRARGYWASCFPEGDGITITSPIGKTPEQVAQDIHECFGWDVETVKGT